MDLAITLGLRKQELIDLYLVRIYLGVTTTMSDNATDDEKNKSSHLERAMHSGLREPDDLCETRCSNKFPMRTVAMPVGATTFASCS
jgi:hypothetical protein